MEVTWVKLQLMILGVRKYPYTWVLWLFPFWTALQTPTDFWIAVLSPIFSHYSIFRTVLMHIFYVKIVKDVLYKFPEHLLIVYFHLPTVQNQINWQCSETEQQKILTFNHLEMVNAGYCTLKCYSFFIDRLNQTNHFSAKHFQVQSKEKVAFTSWDCCQPIRLVQPSIDGHWHKNVCT